MSTYAGDLMCLFKYQHDSPSKHSTSVGPHETESSVCSPRLALAGLSRANRPEYPVDCFDDEHGWLSEVGSD